MYFIVEIQDARVKCVFTCGKCGGKPDLMWKWEEGAGVYGFWFECPRCGGREDMRYWSIQKAAEAWNYMNKRENENNVKEENYRKVVLVLEELLRGLDKCGKESLSCGCVTYHIDSRVRAAITAARAVSLQVREEKNAQATEAEEERG